MRPMNFSRDRIDILLKRLDSSIGETNSRIEKGKKKLETIPKGIAKNKIAKPVLKD